MCVQALEKLIGFLRLHFGPPRLFLLLAGWILALGVWGTLARDLFPMEHRTEWDIPLELRAPLYAKFDSGWYLSIIEWGYGPPPPAGNPSNHAFFPLYPWTAKVLRRTFALDGFHAGLIVAYLALFLALPLFLREGKGRMGEGGAWRSVGYLLLFPTAFFLCAMYAESLFLLLALLAFRETRAGHTGRAVLCGILLGFTKASAMAVAPALFLAGIERRADVEPRPFARRLAPALPAAAAPFAAVWAWVFGIGVAKGEPGLYFRSLAGWQRGSSPIAGALGWFSRAGQYVAGAGWRDDPMRLLDYGCVLLFLFLAIRLLARRRWADAAWALSAIGLPIATGLTHGIPRYVLTVYPAFYEMETMLASRPRIRLVWWILSAALLLLCAARFVNALGVA